MRIISGKLKGRVLKIPKGIKIRPSSQKVKQALFNILGDQVSGSSFLELFAGTGSVGIEAFSRGANRVVLVENNRLCLQAIAENLKSLQVPQAAFKLLGVSVQRAMKLSEQRNEKFDLVFLDPPYHQDQLKNSLIDLSLCDILASQSWVIAEHKKDEILPHLINRLKVMFTKTYGDTALSFYQNRREKQ
ncbi:16S rRNA (guanine(966)-N(2))-methyltransferase RsmD [Candidatus Omnitrophota bacterium]